MIYSFNIIFLLFISYVLCIQINGIVFEVVDIGKIGMLKDDFNEYAKRNYLDITFDVNVFTSANSTVLTNGDRASIHSLLESKSKKYDIYFYVVTHAPEFCDHLLDLNEYISSDIKNIYYSESFNRTCILNNRLIGFPIDRGFTALYTNIELFEKYNKTYPKTWDQLIETAQYIVDKEKESNSTRSLTGYSTMMADDSEGTTSIFEVLHSFRKAVDSYYPDLKSEEAIKALEMIKKLHDLSSTGLTNIIPKTSRSIIKNTLKYGDSVFVKYWGYEDTYPKYKMIVSPGWKEGITTTALGGLDVGITKHIDKSKIYAAVKVLEFILSKEEQKKFVMERKVFTSIKETYDDPEVCTIVDCDLYRNLQPVARYHNERKDYVEYSEKFNKFIFEYLNGNISATEALDKIYDIVGIHQITLDTKETYYGLILFIIILVSSLIVIISSLFLNKKNFKPNFQFLPIDFWYFIIFGILCHIIVNLTEYGEILPYKCRLKIVLYSFGFTFTFVPYLYKLIINFPEENKISNYILNNRFLFFLSFLLCDIILILINFAASYSAKTIISGNGKNYQECKLDDTLSKIIVYSNMGIKLIIFLVIGFLTFIEWNIEETVFDVQVSISSIYIDILSIIMIVVLQYIQFESYILYNALNKLFSLGFALVNFLIFIVLRFALRLIQKKEEDEVKFETFGTTTKSIDSKSQIEDKSTTKHKKYKKIVSYHYQTTISNSNRNSIANSITSASSNQQV
ncbi:periplasmic binding protein-like II [Anaeromyces robustus]|uniref:Periplasmic binding protein-like II n=1 Tax=Anaeromyces robustus TaxID=1754192 RepID=A0A1Y1WTX5_9FUNG|nr:periplasmic binding protein-like II [Anaeromyces robustus]|eukprot:ORX76990.1 periplasmic binding protein-like II [Anaeromyces robustus]